MGFMVAGFLAGAAFSVGVDFLLAMSRVEEAAAEEAAVLPEASVVRLPEISEETPLDVPPTAADEVPPTVATPEIDNHVTALQMASNPDAYRIQIAQRVSDSDVEVTFDEVRASIAKIPTGNNGGAEKDLPEPSHASFAFEGPKFLDLEVHIERTDRSTEVQIRYDTPKPILEEDLELLTTVLNSLEKQLLLPR
jgi:hypothetical protein